MNLSSEKLKIIVDYFATKTVRTVYLFGSYARGDAISASDIDLLLDTDFGITPVSVAVCKRELEALVSMRVDMYQLHKLPKYATKWVSNEKVLLYTSGSARGHAGTSRAIIQRCR